MLWQHGRFGSEQSEFDSPYPDFREKSPLARDGGLLILAGREYLITLLNMAFENRSEAYGEQTTDKYKVAKERTHLR